MTQFTDQVILAYNDQELNKHNKQKYIVGWEKVKYTDQMYTLT